ncbi:MAG: ribonuclease Z [Proteiniphilum sp.]|uniref:ribonuclease Z n=1 Tax=Proteiniphilum sp. TaxID=1926877 RepID=UPI002ABC82E7|nr:ribonuclease Z [Proteiniphilum sp.]MDY9920028.1 ribonuclease Z [Proteiniphilum sp.]
MNKFQVTILGCGSALPTTMHNPPSQLVDLNEKLFMIDCGEGTQLQMRKFKARISKLHSLFISHLHGDHIFGLPGLLSTLSMLGRTGDLHIYAHKEINLLIKPFLIYMGKHMSFRIKLFPLNPERQELLFENKSIRIFSFPLKHRIATNGFLFEEKESPRHIIREMIDLYQIPLKQIPEIKEGADFITSDGTIIRNDILTSPGNPPRRYAYCSDTAYAPEIVPYIKNVDLLYHEATFAESELIRAGETYHSTARQAAEIARAANARQLVIGHYSSRYNELGTLLKEAVAVFPNTELAAEGKVFEL